MKTVTVRFAAETDAELEQLEEALRAAHTDKLSDFPLLDWTVAEATPQDHVTMLLLGADSFDPTNP